VDIVVYDIKSGSVVFRAQDLDFKNCNGAFAIERDTLSFYSDCQYHSLRFWE
jgi:hypothetical protein